MSLFGEYGASKIGSTQIIQLAASTWTEIVLTTLVGGRVAQDTSFVVKAAGAVYAVQGNHGLTIAGVVQVLPVAPNTPAAFPASGPGYFELLQDVPWRIDVESAADNSLWLWASAQTVVRVTEITRTPFDGG